MAFSEMCSVEQKRYEDWRKAHKCLSNVEFSIIPDCVSQSVKVRCMKCNEKIDLTHYEHA